MMLNCDEIEAKGLIVGGSPESLRDAGYDLRIQTLFGKSADGKTEKHEDDFDLEPQGIAAVVSKEVVKLPTNVCAHASVKTSLCREGVLAINIGIIDPGWDGPISSVLLNFGKTNYRLENGDAFLRLTFHTLTPPTKSKPGVPKDRVTYENVIRQKFDKRMAETFMDLEKAARKGSEKFAADMRGVLIKYVPAAAFVLVVMTFLMNFSLLYVVSRAMPFDALQSRAEALSEAVRKQSDAVRLENEGLKKQIDAMKTQLDRLSNQKQKK